MDKNTTQTKPSQADFLLGIQPTTGRVHLGTTKQTPRCGNKAATRYLLTLRRGSLEEITCSRCKSLAQKEAKASS